MPPQGGAGEGKNTHWGTNTSDQDEWRNATETCHGKEKIIYIFLYGHHHTSLAHCSSDAFFTSGKNSVPPPQKKRKEKKDTHPEHSDAAHDGCVLGAFERSVCRQHKRAPWGLRNGGPAVGWALCRHFDGRGGLSGGLSSLLHVGLLVPRLYTCCDYYSRVGALRAINAHSSI